VQFNCNPIHETWMHMKKAFHAVLSLVAVGGALVGAMPASAGFNTIVNTAHPMGTGHTLVNLASPISGSTGQVLASGGGEAKKRTSPRVERDGGRLLVPHRLDVRAAFQLARSTGEGYVPANDNLGASVAVR
jgi:hypothetical protein